MAEGETEKEKKKKEEHDTRKTIEGLRGRFHRLTAALKESPGSPLEASLHFCQEFCQVLVENVGRWKTDEDPLPLLEVYTVAILSFAKATSCLSSECENVPLLLEKLALSCVELLLLLPQHVPVALWEEFQSSMKLAHSLLQETGNTQLRVLSVMAQQGGVWSNATLSGILSSGSPQTEQVHEFLELEGPMLLNMRLKHLIKMDSIEKAAILAKICSEYPGYEGKGNFKQIYLVCICMTKTQEQLMEEITSIDCKDALDMICNLESEGDEKGALCLCTAFLKRQLLQEEVYCAWELTLFWSKLLIRLESSADVFLEQSKKMALLCRSVCHILFFIKVIQNEVGEVGLPVCVEMCIQAAKMTTSDHKDSKSTICKTIYCLLPNDLEVKRACQLTEFLLQPTVDSYYSVESLYNEPDQKPEEEGNLPVLNSLRCDLLLALKTQWPFDPEFWDWRTLKRNCLALMGEEAAIVSSIDTLNDAEEQEEESMLAKAPEYKDLEDFLLNTTNELNEITDEREKNREAKKLREQGFVSARFRNWRAYMQYCVLCDKEFLGHRIVRHAQKHFKDGMYMCPICADSFESREVLEPHVASHVKQSCKERLAAMKAARKVGKPVQPAKSPSKNVKVAVKTNISPVKIEPSNGNYTGTIPDTQVNSTSPVSQAQGTSETQLSQDCFCPVQNCSKAFKFFRNLMAHVRCHKDDAEAMRFLEIQKQKVVCQYCRRQFVNVKHLNDHLQMHCGIKPYICIQLDCKASFNSNSELLMHRKTHPEFQARCMFPNCGQIFNEAYLLYDHEAQHYLTYTNQVVNCEKVLHPQSQCLSHQESHGTHDTVNNPPPSNENLQPPPNIQPTPQVTPIKEEKCSAFVRLERIDTEAYMKDPAMESSSPSKCPLILKEPIPVRVKHSVESMLNSVENQNLEAKEPEKCYTPLTNPAPATADAQGPPEALHQHPTTVVEHVENPPVYPVPCTTNNVDGAPGEGIDNGVTRVFQTVPPQILSPSQIKSENPCSSQGYTSSMPAATGNEENMHCCPYKDCSRAYSTNKSLSRHVKKQHPEIFEDWKLAKKYNKVVKIAAKKISTIETASPGQSHRSPNPQMPPLCNTPGMQQMDYSVGCSSSPTPCYPGSVDPVPITPMMNPTLYPSWGSPGNSTGLMNSDVSQDWPSSPMNNCFPDVFNVAEYPPRSYPQWQPDPYQTTTPLPNERDHSLAATHSGTMLHTSDSTLMSQYVSSSLMLDNGAQIHNGGQQYGLMQPEVSVDGNNVRKMNSNMTGQPGHNNSVSTVENLPGGTYHAPYDQNAAPSLPPKISGDMPEKCEPDIQETQGILKATNVIPKAATPEAKTPGFDTIDSSAKAMLSPQSIITTDLPLEEDLSTVDCETNPSDDKSSDADAPKGKRNRLSKRTKWPAIIKDGKVICRRCFREFTSTKSLGGHLSKRSQCKPLDEVDLTADLPTSFLDFLNDPLVPDATGSIFNMTNGEFSQESCSLTTLTPQVIKTEPQNSVVDSSSSDPLPSAFTEQPSQTNSNHKEKAPEPTDASQTVPRTEDHLMEISKAFQRLDLIEAAQERLKMEKMSMAQHVDISDDGENSKTPKEKHEEMSREKLPKPFKCDQDDCEYAFMTKEALFKHLSKMHDYTNDMIEELKRTPVKFSPYPCQICPKTFTRTTGLRIHYEKVHRLTKPEMLKLKFSARNRRVFRLAKEDSYSSRTAIDANTLRTTRSYLTTPGGIKQEPLDIAIETQTDHDDNPLMVTTAYDSAEEGIASEISTVTKLPSPHNYLSDGQNCEMSSSSMPDTTQEEPGEDRANPVPELNEKLGEVSVVLNHDVPSDKPSGSKTSPTKDEQPKREKTPKKLGLKMGDPDAFSPYRPYRCVHEGCSAAFTIQQNLILHYRAMHQASLPLTRAEGDPEQPSVISGQETVVKDDEVRCQVKDCSRVFMGITKLIQHYLLLHKFSRDKATAMMSTMNVGVFKCDREECSLPFECADKYIEHIKNFHKEIAISESGSVDMTYKCEFDGCECVYTTKSNLLRHLIKKHEYVYDPKSSDGRRTKSTGLFGQGGSEKEHLESKYKVKKKNIKKKEIKMMDHWSSFGKPALKSHEEASALCTKKSSLQYPCMIIGCDTVERAERSIFKHYTTHGLTERYIEDHRSQFIFCKKYSRSRFKDANKSEGMSTSSSSSEVSEAEESETEDSNPNGPNAEDNIAEDYSKLSTDESSESQASTVAEGNKKGRPRKPTHPTPACSERMQTLRNRLTVSSSRENSNPGTPSAQEEQCDEGIPPGSYKPLELEDSFLQFLETSESTQASKRKLSDRAGVELPAKRQHTIRQKSAQRGKLSNELSDCANLVDFKNPLNLKLVNNVKIAVDKTFSDGADLLLKQLQDMRPIVIIKKWLCSGS